MATVVRERERIQAIPNGRVRKRYVDATMTRAAREERIVWRLEHLAAWQHDLESLAHFNPDYPYDVAHEYDHDWTTDPDYGAEGVHFSEFEEDGVLIDDDSRPSRLQEHMLDTARDRIGRRTLTEATYVFLPQQIAHLKLTTQQGSPVDRVKPDLVVMPSETDLLEANDPTPGRTAKLDDPVPELVLEILSKTTATRDLDTKRHLYETLGVGEYLVYDLGGKRWPGSPRELLMYRLVDGAYEVVAPLMKTSALEPDTVWSGVFNTHIRFLPDAREDAEEFRHLPEGHRPSPRFQWYDPEEGRWRDTETDTEHERNRIVQERDQVAQERDQVAQERDQATQERDQATQKRTDMAVDMMREFLGSELEPEHLDWIEKVWRGNGPPTDAARRVRTVLQTPHEWRFLLGLPPDDDHGSDRTPTPPGPQSPKNSR